MTARAWFKSRVSGGVGETRKHLGDFELEFIGNAGRVDAGFEEVDVGEEGVVHKYSNYSNYSNLTRVEANAN